jgi:hypothetical protein
LPKEKSLAKKEYNFCQERKNKPIRDIGVAKRKKKLTKKRYQFCQEKKI